MSKSLNEALFKVTNALESVKKSSDNPFFKSKYADLNSHLDLIKPILEKEGVLLTQPTIVNSLGQTLVQTVLTHVASGERLESAIAIPMTVTDPQKIGASITYFRRFAINSLFALKSEDDDGETASGRGATKSTQYKDKPVDTTKKVLNKLDEKSSFSANSTSSGRAF